jgi:hypothetical protein
VVLFIQTPQGIWNGAAGFSEMETSTRMKPVNLFDAASVTKIYTAAAIMLLVEDRVLELDANISRYLPDTVYGRLPNGTSATVRQLLDHTSGIPDFSGTPRYMADLYADPMGEYPVEKLLGYVYEQSPVGPAGTVSSYSNTNYFLLAMMQDSGCGLDVNETGYGKEIGRSGDDLGAQIQIEYFPDSKSTIVLLMNAGDSGNPGNVFRRLWDEVLNAALGDDAS